MQLPNLIVGGAPKCGTSSLYFWLASHPEVFASKTKETFFFSDNINRFNKKCNCIKHNISDYSKFFQNSKKEKIRFEATAAYLYSKNAIKGFLELKNPPKIIFIFREPSAQIYSHYKMERYRTKRTSLPLEEYIKLKKIDNYVQYGKHLKNWINKYPKNLIKVLIFEELMEKKKIVMQGISNFLEINEEYYLNFDFEHRNESVAIRSSFLHQLGLKLQPLIPHKLQSVFLPFYMRINSSGKVKSKKEDVVVIKRLKEKYQFVQKELLQIKPHLPLHHWSR